MNTSNKIFSENSLSRIGRKINYLDLKIESSMFDGLRLSTSIILFGILILLNYGFIFAPLFTIIYYLLFEYALLDLNIIRRRKKLERDAIEYFNLFLLASSTNRNFKKSISITNDLLVENSMSKEFDKVIKDVNLGKSFDEALRLMEKRIPSDLIVNILYSIIEANRAGNNLNDSIKNQIKYMEEKETNRLINQNKSIPLKMLITFLIFMSIMLIIMVIFKNI